MTDLMKWIVDPSLLALLFMTACICLVLLNWHYSGKIDLSQCIVDTTTQRVSIEKVGYMTGLLIGTWGFVDRILTNTMTEYYFSGYMMALVAGRALNTGINAFKDVKNVPPPAAP